MRDFLRRHGALLIALAVISAVFFGWSWAKSGFFIDEIYTYGLSNSDYAPFLNDVTGGKYPEVVLTREDLTDYVSVDGDEGFDADSVFYNQKEDVHPPLYYLIFNAVSSLFPNTFSKWTGLCLNYIFFILCLWLLYLISQKLFGDKRISIGVIILYGLSNIALSTALMIRMYILSTLLTVLLAYLALCFRKDPRPLTAAQAGLVICLGLLTHYFFVLYAAFLCISVMVGHFRDRRPREAFRYFLASMVGGLSAYLLFPAMREHLFADKLVSGGTAVSNLKNIAAYPKALAKYAFYAVKDIWIAVVVGLALVVLITVFAIKAKRSGVPAEKVPSTNALMLVIPAFAAFGVAAVISPVFTLRYIYNLIPLFVIFVGYLADKVMEKLDGTPLSSKLSVSVSAALLALNLVISAAVAPEYIHKEQRQFNALLAEYADSPCLYFTANYYSPLTQDLSQLLIFDDVAVSHLPESDTVVNYLASAGEFDHIVVFVDVDKFWSAGLDADNYVKRVGILTGLKSSRLLYSYGLSEVYVVSAVG